MRLVVTDCPDLKKSFYNLYNDVFYDAGSLRPSRFVPMCLIFYIILLKVLWIDYKRKKLLIIVNFVLNAAKSSLKLLQLFSILLKFIQAELGSSV